MSNRSVRMINGRFGDPSLFISLAPKRAILFDCGDINRLSRKEVSSVERLFLTHTHMDHLFGFDRLLRISIDARKQLEIYGPPGIRERLEHKFQGITHNLEVQRPLRIKVVELHPNYALECWYPYATHFQPEQESKQELDLLSEIYQKDTIRLKKHEVLSRTLKFEDYHIAYSSLLHVVPVLSYKLTLITPSKLDIEKAKELGLTPGPWIKELQGKQGQDFPVEIEGKTWSSKELFQKLMSNPMQDAVGYVTDTVHHPKVERRIKHLMENVKYFFCDSCYVNEDVERAQKYFHLTTTQAGELAKACKVEKLITFHFSLKYGKDFNRLIQETAEVFSKVAPLEGIGDNTFSF